MTEAERLLLLERLERLGAEDDADALQAARELAAQVAESGLDWDDLIAPEDPPDDAFDFDELDPDDDADAGDGAEAEPLPEDRGDDMQLLTRLLERKGLSRNMKEELQELRREAGQQGLSEIDRRYLRALAKRLGGGGK